MADKTAYPLVLGVYSLKKVVEIGSGTTTVDHKNITYWYLRQMGDDAFERQPLGPDALPSGLTQKCSLRELIGSFTPEPLYYRDNPVPDMDALAENLLADPEDETALDRLDDGQWDVLKALLVDPVEIPLRFDPDYMDKCRAVLGRGRAALSTLLCRGQAARFTQLTRLNGFGVRLRKDGRLEESISYFAKALDMDRNDEHLLFNMARVYYDKGDFEQCRKALQEALTLNPEFPEAGMFARFMARKTFSPA